jgi:hypothetical protein
MLIRISTIVSSKTVILHEYHSTSFPTKGEFVSVFSHSGRQSGMVDQVRWIFRGIDDANFDSYDQDRVNDELEIVEVIVMLV